MTKEQKYEAIRAALATNGIRDPAHVHVPRTGPATLDCEVEVTLSDGTVARVHVSADLRVSEVRKP